MLRSPLRWVGGKFRVRDQIIALFPPHTCYVEVFSGAAWVLFGKPPEMSKSEVLNDLDGELINFWRVIKHRPAEFSEAASKVLGSRELFDEWKLLAGNGDEIMRAVQFYAVIRLAFGARRAGNVFARRLDKRPEITWPVIHRDLHQVVLRLRQCWIERLSWQECLAKYDRATTLFYLDPPYRVDGARAYRHWFKDADHEALAQGLAGVKGRWILSYNDDAFIRRLYGRRGLRMGHLDVPYRIQRGPVQVVRELLIRNF